MASLCALVIRGGRKPDTVLRTSRTLAATVFDVVPSTFIHPLPIISRLLCRFDAFVPLPMAKITPVVVIRFAFPRWVESL